MYNPEYERMIRARGREAASEDDALARYMEINGINAELTRISASAEGLEEVGLGSSAEAALAHLAARLDRPTGENTSNHHGADTVLIAVSVERMSQALSLVRLPDNDQKLFARMYRMKNNKYVYTDVEMREMAKHLQPLTITVLPNRLVLRNKIPGLEAECPLPARAIGQGLSNGGLSFTINFSKLYNLFKPSDITVPGRVRRLHNRDKKELLLLRLDLVTSSLQLIYNGALLNVSVEMELVPEPLLADLGRSEGDRPFPAELFSKSFAVIDYLGGGTGDVQIQRGRMSTDGLHALRVTASAFGEHDLAIPSELVPPLRRLFGWIRDGASIRRSGGHYIVSKQNYIVVCAAGRTADADADADDRFGPFREGGFHVQLDTDALVLALRKPQCLCGRKETLDGAALKLFAGQAQAAAICATRTEQHGDINTSMSYLPAKYVSSITENNASFTLDPAFWTRIVLSSSAEKIDLFYNPELRFPLIELRSKEIVFEVVLYSDLLEDGNLKAFSDAAPSSRDWTVPEPTLEMHADDENCEATFMNAVNRTPAAAPQLGDKPEYETFGYLAGGKAEKAIVPISPIT